MSNFDNYIDSPLLISKEVMVLRKEALKALNLVQIQGATSDKCLYAALMTMFDAGFAAALKLEKDKGESSTVA